MLSLFQKKAKQPTRSSNKQNVLPGIVATVTDDKKNEIYVDIDLELEPEQNTADTSSSLNIPPGLAATVTQKRINKFFDLKRYLQRHHYEAITIACGAIIAISAGIAVYLMYAAPINVPAPYPVVKPLQPLEAQESQPAVIHTQEASQPQPPPAVQEQKPSKIIAAEKVADASPPIQEPVPVTDKNNLPSQKEQSKNTSLPERQSTRPQLPPEPSVPPQESANYYLYAGYTCETQNDFAGALEWYKKALAYDPQGFQLLNKISFVLLKMSLYAEAATYAEKALSIKKNYIPALINMGIIRAHQEKFEEAEQFFDHALKLDNTNVSALYNYMLLYKKQGDYKRAAELQQKLSSLGYPSKK